MVLYVRCIGWAVVADGWFIKKKMHEDVNVL